MGSTYYALKCQVAILTWSFVLRMERVVLTRDEYDKFLDVCRKMGLSLDDCVAYAIMNLIYGQ